MNKEQEKAKTICNKITSYAPWSEWNGVPREMIEKYIAEGLKEYAKERAIGFYKYFTGNQASAETLGLDYDLYFNAQLIENQNKEA